VGGGIYPVIDSNAAGGGTTAAFSLGDGETNLTIDAGLVTVGQYVTYTVGGWGATPNGNNVASLLQAKFPTLYGSKKTALVIGGGKTITLTSSAAVSVYIADGKAPGVLTTSYTNPTGTSAGVFGSQVLGLRLNVDFSNAGYIKPGLAALKVAPGYSLAGQTVAQVLATVNAVLGGGALPAGITSVSQLNVLVTAINQNFDNGTSNNGVLVP
jgi:hypothetical protein